MTLETLITFLTIENNNMNNDIVTFEYRVMVTAFAILAMFRGIPGIKSHIVHSLVANWGSRKLNSLSAIPRREIRQNISNF